MATVASYRCYVLATDATVPVALVVVVVHIQNAVVPAGQEGRSRA